MSRVKHQSRCLVCNSFLPKDHEKEFQKTCVRCLWNVWYEPNDFQKVSKKEAAEKVLEKMKESKRKSIDMGKKESDPQAPRPDTLDRIRAADEFMREARERSEQKKRDKTPEKAKLTWPPQGRTVYISGEAFGDMLTIARLYPEEIGGMGEVEKTDHGLVLTKVHMVQQVCGPAHVNLLAESILDLQLEIEREDRNPDNLRCFWHSHVNMGVGPSGTDVEQFARWTQQGIHGPEWFLNLIINRRAEIYAQLDITDPVSLQTRVEPQIGYPVRDGKNWVQEIKEKVSRGPDLHWKEAHVREN